ncbi:hypothetical protein SLEP1_g12411 [Rubroshorea leprosula]|uniref:Uncharacterized protein n=1 Tax=Rubroshorea leprosula TaxID=152421 RepID=A0AAV5ICF0_9ROSI|nr:hypothetical protein SLEP1_g12411 [Rubroshorea leprosula]
MLSKPTILLHLWTKKTYLLFLLNKEVVLNKLILMLRHWSNKHICYAPIWR